MANDGFLKRKGDYNPDVLSCLANLSNDEVFTPPDLVNKMLDLLPQDIFSNPETTFLDPACKTGVFLREIAKRLMAGLAEALPDEDKRREHIFKKQLFGIAITELTALMSRRTVYCSKDASCEYSIVKFPTSAGNIRFEPIRHKWEGGRCRFCGASQKANDRDESLESHAYEFIHTLNPKEIFNMHFDVIIGNPPYQMEDGGNGASARPIYHLFVEAAKKLSPRYLVMIIPARWYAGGKGLDGFRQEMIQDKHIIKLFDFEDASVCFSGVEIKGGVCYFLRDKNKEDKCHIVRFGKNGTANSARYLKEEGVDVFIRDERIVSVKNKVWAYGGESFMSIVSSRKPYGIPGDFFNNEEKYCLPCVSESIIKNGLRIVGLSSAKRVYKYVANKYPLPRKGLLHDYKIFITRNYGCGELGEIPASPILAEPGDLCTETFIEIGPFATINERDNAYSYMKTKLFRVLVGIMKQDQGASRSIYRFVPMQDFSKPWVDEELYKKYNLTKDEIAFIESMIKPME